MFIKTVPAAKATAQLLINTASSYLGYQAGPMMRNQFGERVGYNNQPWSGAFIDVIARECGLQLPSFVYTGTGLAEAINLGLVQSRPRPGDIVIFRFASENAASAFAMPHIGLVTDTRELSSTGRFITIEGNSRPANAKYGQDTDGVNQRVRHLGDALTFIRPGYNRSLSPGNLLIKLIMKLSGPRAKKTKLETAAIEEAARENRTVVPAALRPGLRNRQVEVVQLALGVAVGLQGAQRGSWDSSTANAFANFQRKVGYVGTDANGIPDLASLKRLGQDTGLFRVNE